MTTRMSSWSLGGLRGNKSCWNGGFYSGSSSRGDHYFVAGQGFALAGMGCARDAGGRSALAWKAKRGGLRTGRRGGLPLRGAEAGRLGHLEGSFREGRGYVS